MTQVRTNEIVLLYVCEELAKQINIDEILCFRHFTSQIEGSTTAIVPREFTHNFMWVLRILGRQSTLQEVQLTLQFPFHCHGLLSFRHQLQFHLVCQWPEIKHINGDNIIHKKGSLETISISIQLESLYRCGRAW